MKKLQPSKRPSSPGYPSLREHIERKALLGAVAAGLGVVAAGCRGTLPVQPRQNTSTSAAMPAIADAQPRVIEVCTAGELPVEPTTNEVAATLYVIQKGDTLSGVAKQRLGSANRWPEIVKANPGLNPKKLRVGQAIRLPTAVK